jgi:hypothetical protein
MQQVDHRLAEAVEEDDYSSVDEVVEEDDTSWSRLDIFLSVYVFLVIWGPVFAALLLSFILPLMKPDLELNLARALGYAGGILFLYLLAMAQLSRRKPRQLFFLHAVYYTLLIYVDAGASFLLLLFLPESAILFLSITLAGWLFLILVARRIILASHDYLFSETMPINDNSGTREDRLEATFQRGIDENAFRYKYIPKTHLILICNVCIFCGIIMGSLVWKDSLKINLPVSFVCVVDIFYSSCFRFEDEDEDEDVHPPPDVIIQPADGLLVIQHTDKTRATTQEEQGGLV